MKKRLLTLFLAICMICTLLPFDAFAATTGLNVTYHSRKDVLSYLENTDFTVIDEVSYKKAPNYNAPYSAGVLSDNTKENAIKVLNVMRYIAGLDPVTWDSASEKGTQAAAAVSYANGHLSHSPSKPEGMDDALFQLGYDYCGKSNLGMGYRNLEFDIIHGWLADDSKNNIGTVGHRRWCLNPTMGKTSFGAFVDYDSSKMPSYAMYAFDSSNTTATQTTVAWPAQVMPIEYFRTAYPWSVTIGKTLDISKVKVTLIKDDGTTWNFSESSKDGEFYVDNNYYGQPGCIIFRPKNVEKYLNGDVYTVKITGIPKPLEYTVTFISMHDCSSSGHLWKNLGDVIKEATCEETGIREYTCTVCGVTETEKISALGHDCEYKATTKPTTSAEGKLTGTCSRCNKTVTITLPKLNKTDYTYKVTKTATCTETGTASYTWNTTKYGTFSFAVTLPKTAHSTAINGAKDATCTAKGYTGDKVCKNCSQTVEKGKETAALGHNYKDGICTRCGVTKNPFVDVKKADYYYDSVLWAYYHDPQITTGVDKTHFAPGNNCTRGQIVTFLWRANGCPEVKGVKNPFKDVKSSDYYYKAVLWAVSEKITTGIDNTHFAPDQTCTRAQSVTFMWRAEGQHGVKDVKNPFKDVKTSDYYYNAVLWALGKNITNGVDNTHFAPNNTCTRGQIVTFLYRDMV